MPLPLIPVNALAIPTGTPHFTLSSGISDTDSAMTLTDGTVAASILPIYGNVRLLVYKVGDTNPEYVDMTSRSGAVLQISREVENKPERPKSAHGSGASVWIVQTADMVIAHTAIGAAVLLEEHIASNSAQLDFTKITSDYDEYIIEIEGLVPATNGVELFAKLSTDGGSTYLGGTGYGSVGNITIFNANTPGAAGTTSQWSIHGGFSGSTIANTSKYGLSGSYHFYNPMSTTLNKRLHGVASYIDTASHFIVSTVMGDLDSLSAVNAIRFLMSSGNITSGIIRLYGVSKTVDVNALTTEAFAVIEDQKAQNTQGGGFTSGTWQTRTLNTIVSDTNGIVSLASNQITVQPGKYKISTRCPAYRVDNHMSRLYDITHSVVLQQGSSEFAYQGSSDHPQTDSVLEGIFVFSAPTTMELQHFCGNTLGTNGFGRATNIATEVYASVRIQRIGAKIVGEPLVLYAPQTADQAVSGSTWTTLPGCSLTLSPGTYKIDSAAKYTAAGGNRHDCLRLWDGTTSWLHTIQGVPGGFWSSLHMSGKLVVTATTTFTLQLFSEIGGTAERFGGYVTETNSAGYLSAELVI